jgi:GAF domain-containing protein
MADSFIIDRTQPKAKQYADALTQLTFLTEDEGDWVANVSNVMACLKYGFDFFWVGIYLVKEDELVLGPFQGPVACTRIKKGRGVCGSAWEQNKTLLVADVDAFPGHIACSSDSKSEVVVPLRDKSGHVIGVFDIDSEQLDNFDLDDQKGLEAIGNLLSNILAS